MKKQDDLFERMADATRPFMQDLYDYKHEKDKMKSYHNTVPEGSPLPEYEQKARTQDEIILQYFIDNAEFNHSPSDVYYGLSFNIKGTPITSIRRAITNLTNSGNLTKTGMQTMGMHGRSENIWKLASPQLKLKL